jgi:hypothetical protein
MSIIIMNGGNAPFAVVDPIDGKGYEAGRYLTGDDKTHDPHLFVQAT